MTSLKKNFIYQIAYQILLVIMPLITSPYLSRIVGSKGLGEYSYSYTIAYYFSLFILLGVNNHGAREIAKVKNNKIEVSKKFFSIYSVQLAMGIIILFLYVLTQIIWQEENLLAKIQLIYVVSAVFDINWFFFGLEKFKITVTRNFVIKLGTVLAVFVFVKSPMDINIYTMIMALGALISQLLLLPFLHKDITPIKINRTDVVENIKPLLILFVPVVAASIFKYMDKILLGTMRTKSELGLYDNSEKIMSIPTGVIIAIGTVMLPRITNMMQDSNKKDKVNQYIRLSMAGSMMIAFALAFGLAAIAPTFAPWFWGEEFTRCGILIRTISVTIVFLSWANVIRTQFLIPNNRDMIFVRSTIYGAIVNFIINYALIEKYGAFGTVIGTVMAEFTLAFYQTIKCKKDLPIKSYVIDAAPFLVSGVIMYVCVILISTVNLDNQMLLLFVEIIAGAIVYSGLVLIYLMFIKKYKFIDLLKLLKKG